MAGASEKQFTNMLVGRKIRDRNVYPPSQSIQNTLFKIMMTNYSQNQNNDYLDQELTIEELQEISGSGFAFELVKTFGKEFVKWFAKKGYNEVKG